MRYDMGASPTATSPRRPSTARRLVWPLIALLASVTVGSLAYTGVSAARMQAGGGAPAAAPAARIVLPGTASASGTVTASKPFVAAQVYFRNPQKRVTYMSYTGAGAFTVVAMFPGDYEAVVRAKGLESDVQKLSLKAGDAPKLTFTLHDAAENSYVEQHFGAWPRRIKYGSYEELFPPDKGRDVLERTCMRCHGADHESLNPGSRDYWYNRIDVLMMGRDLWERPSTGYQEGMLNYRNTPMRFSREDHKDLTEYLVKYHGPTAERRAVRTTKEAPVDEAVLAKAQYIEFALAPDPPGKDTKAPEYIQIGYRGRRVVQDPRFDVDGNVWGLDRAYPPRLVKLDPRTGEYRDFYMPDPIAEPHDFIISRDGIIWIPQHGGAIPYGPQRMWGFNTKTEKFDYAIDMDPDNFIRMPIKWMQSLAEDSKGNIIASWFMGGALSMWHKAENKVTVHPMPMSNSQIYGTVIGPDDTTYSAEYTGKIEGFHTWTATGNGKGEWVEWTPPNYPAQLRRPNVDYQGNVIYGIWGGGPEVPGNIGVLNPTTGRHTTYISPEQTFQPYDTEPDPDLNRLWFANTGTPDRAANLGVLDRKTGKWTFYPKPQFDADTPKIQVSRDGAIWYAPRGSTRMAGLGALYPDKDKIVGLGAYYVNGPPGYPFKTPRDAKQPPAPAAKR